MKRARDMAFDPWGSPEGRALEGLINMGKLGSSGHFQAIEGQQDANLFIAQNECDSLRMVQFRRSLERMMFEMRDVRAQSPNDARVFVLMNPKFRKQFGVEVPREIVATPAETLAEACVNAWREKAVPGSVMKPQRVMGQGLEWCRCMASALMAARLPKADIDALHSDFMTHVDRIRAATTNQALKSACYRR